MRTDPRQNYLALQGRASANRAAYERGYREGVAAGLRRAADIVDEGWDAEHISQEIRQHIESPEVPDHD